MSIGADYQVTVSGALSEAVGKDFRLNIGADGKLAMGRNVSLAAGNAIIVEAQGTVIISATDELILKCGQASIVLKKNGDISITGNEVSIKAPGDIVLKRQKILQN